MYFISLSILLLFLLNSYCSIKIKISEGWSNVIKRLKLNVLSFCAAKLDSNDAMMLKSVSSLLHIHRLTVFLLYWKRTTYWNVLLKLIAKASDIHVFVLGLFFHKEHFCSKHFICCKLDFNPYVIALNLTLFLLLQLKYCSVCVYIYIFYPMRLSFLLHDCYVCELNSRQFFLNSFQFWFGKCSRLVDLE